MTEPTPLLLIKTRLAPPRIGAAPVRRQQILSVLDARRNDKLTLIVGPGGSGKTTLSTLWRQELVTLGCDVAWYNLSRDDDEALFAAYLAASLQNLGLHIGAHALAAYGRSGAKSFNALLAEVVNGLHQHDRPLYLFLEDFHYVSSPAIVQFIDRLTALAPPNFHLVITSRVRPPLNLVPLRVRDEVTEIGFADLRFSFDESASMLRNQRIDSLSVAQLRTLYHLTDGWAAGLQIAAFSLRKTADPGKYLERFGGTLAPSNERTLSDYLQQCVGDHLDAEELGFLVRTSACRRFNRELCELITGNARAGELLAKFDAENLFVLPIDSDDTVQWYRFHRLFAKFLNDQLVKLPEPELKQINQRASHWFAGKHLWTEAIRHANHARDDGLCVELIERSARAMINSAHFIQLLKWFALVPRDSVRERLDLLLCVAWAQVVAGKLADFEWSIETILAHPCASKPTGHFEVQLLMAQKMTRLDDTAAVLELLAPYLESPPPGSPFSLLMLCTLSSLALVYANQFERARDLVRARRRGVTPQRAVHASPFVDAMVGLSFLIQGDMWQAKEALLKTLDEARSSSALGEDPAGFLAGYLAEAHYQLDELGQAEALLERYADLIDLVGVSDSVLFAHRVQARLCHANGQTDAALRVLDRLEEAAQQQGLDRMLAGSLAQRVHLEIQRNRLPAAREALRRLQQIATAYQRQRNCAYADIPFAAAVAEAELAAALHEPARALELIEPLIADCDAQGRLYDATLLRVRAAVIRAKQGRCADAVPILSAALTVASEYGMARVFIDEGEPALALLRELLSREELHEQERAYAESTLRRVEPRQSTVASPTGRVDAKAPRPIDALSPRELEILELLAKALSTKSIAKALNVSAGTVKWHLKNVYGKLGAASREDAVAKGRNMRLIR